MHLHPWTIGPFQRQHNLYRWSRGYLKSLPSCQHILYVRGYPEVRAGSSSHDYQPFTSSGWAIAFSSESHGASGFLQFFPHWSAKQEGARSPRGVSEKCKMVGQNGRPPRISCNSHAPQTGIALTDPYFCAVIPALVLHGNGVVVIRQPVIATSPKR